MTHSMAQISSIWGHRKCRLLTDLAVSIFFFRLASDLDFAAVS
jgi:hypothetical protein